MYKLCKTPETIARQKQIEQALLQEMLSKPYTNITITGICERIQLPRKAFYRYFPTKNDALAGLIDHTLMDCSLLVLRNWTGNAAFSCEDMVRFFHFWYNQKDFLDAMKKNELRVDVISHAFGFISEKRAKSEKTSVDEARFCTDQIDLFVIWGLFSMVFRWHYLNFPCSTEEMARSAVQALNSPDISLSRLLL